MKTESIIGLLVVGVLAYFGYDYLKKQSGGVTPGQISAAVGNPATVQTESSQIGWQIPYTQPTYMPTKTFIGELPEQAY